MTFVNIENDGYWLVGYPAHCCLLSFSQNFKPQERVIDFNCFYDNSSNKGEINGKQPPPLYRFYRCPGMSLH